MWQLYAVEWKTLDRTIGGCDWIWVHTGEPQTRRKWLYKKVRGDPDMLLHVSILDKLTLRLDVEIVHLGLGGGLDFRTVRYALVAEQEREP